MDFYLTGRASVNGKFTGERSAKITFLVVADDVIPTPADAISSDAWRQAVVGTLGQSPGKAGRPPIVTGDVVFIVHGFNETFEDAVKMHILLKSGLIGKGYPAQGAPVTFISFDWPSEGSTFAYSSDLDAAAYTAVDLVRGAIRPLLQFDPNCRVRMNAVGHSLGAYVLRDALDHVVKGVDAPPGWTIGQLALVAGDIDAEAFARGDADTMAMVDRAHRLTNYFNRYDAVLMISNVKRAGVAERVGRVGLPPGSPPSTVNVDCSDRYRAQVAAGLVTPVLGSHSWYFADDHFLTDLAQTLSGEVDRAVVAERESLPGGGFGLAV